MGLTKGISAIIPTYKGQDYIKTLLDSLKNQTLDYNLFEAIFIVNGELDNTPKIIQNFLVENPELNIILTDSEIGVCNARNHGIQLASREYTIFIDDDDYISPKYFETLLKYAKKGRIVIGTFMDVDEDTGEVKPSYLTPPLLEKSGIIENAYSYMKDILVITTDKLIPTENVKNSSFNPELKNGVDIGYYSIFYMEHKFEFYVVDKSEEAIYYRLWRDDSISRKPLSYDFNVTDRLKVINEINKGLKIAKTQEDKSFLESLTGGQVLKINKYLEKYPQDLKKVMSDINSYNYSFFPYKYFNEDIELLDNPNNELIISYAFPPTNTTTSNVVAKRILTGKNNVSVICGSLNNLNKDFTLEKVVNQFVLDKMVVDIHFENSWINIKEFTKKGLKKLEGKIYDKIYSRANFVHSHFLGYEYKLANKNTYWIAEFSDPLIYNFDGIELSPAIADEKAVEHFNKHLPENFEKIKTTDSINFIGEYLTYIFADEIVFTNENQKELMINNFPYDIEDLINQKAVISPHPVLDKKYYYMKEKNYEIDDSCVNFAYFGVIFAERDIEDFINGLDLLDEIFQDKYRLHLFTPNRTMFEQILSQNVFEKTTINPTIDFLEFLNLSSKFDVLLVEDSKTKDKLINNPFLPSKISDYVGSGADIWAACEDGSIMDKWEIKYKSRLNDVESAKITANQIMEDKLDLTIDSNKNKSSINTTSYLKKRNLHLAKKIEELIQVAQEEFKKDGIYEQKIQKLEKENSELLKYKNKPQESKSLRIKKSLKKIVKKY